MTQRALLFTQAYAAFEPSPDDSPNAIPFYRAFAGLRAAWGNDFCDKYNHALHQAACECGTADKPYTVAIKVLQFMVEGYKPPERPTPSYSYNLPPQPPTEQDARTLFNEAFKEAFPGRRANSKLANEKWIEKREKAMAIMQGRYEIEKVAYDKCEQRREDQNRAHQQKWLDSIHQAALFEDAVREIIHDETAEGVN